MSMSPGSIPSDRSMPQGEKWGDWAWKTRCRELEVPENCAQGVGPHPTWGRNRSVLKWA